MSVSSYTTIGLVALSLIPGIGSLWEKSQPIVSDVEVTSRTLDNNTYRISLNGTIRKGCEIESGSARMVEAPHDGSLGQWEFTLDSGAQDVSLEVVLVCFEDRRKQTLWHEVLKHE